MSDIVEEEWTVARRRYAALIQAFTYLEVARNSIDEARVYDSDNHAKLGALSRTIRQELVGLNARIVDMETAIRSSISG